MMTLSALRDKMKRLDKAATAGPWRVTPQMPIDPATDWHDHIEADATPLGSRAILFSPNSNLPPRYAEPDAALVCLLRNHAPLFAALIDVAEAGEAIRSELDSIHKHEDCYARMGTGDDTCPVCAAIKAYDEAEKSLKGILHERSDSPRSEG